MQDIFATNALEKRLVALEKTLSQSEDNHDKLIAVIDELIVVCDAILKQNGVE